MCLCAHRKAEENTWENVKFASQVGWWAGMTQNNKKSAKK